MQVKRKIFCSELASGAVAPVTATKLGTLMEQRPYGRQRPFYIDKGKPTKESEKTLKAIYRNQQCEGREIRLFKFLNATVIGQGTVLLADGSLLCDSATEFLNQGLIPEGMSGTFASLTFDETDTKVQGKTILVKRPWYRNHGHYLVDLLPILPAIHDAGIEVDNIVYGELPEGNTKDLMLDCAKTFFPEAQVLLADDVRPLKFEELYYVEPVHVPPMFKHPTALEYARDTLRKLCSAEVPAEAPSRLYLARQHNRRIQNQDEFEDYLTSKGFVPIYCENLNLSEQINAFENAEIVVGVKGAAFTNLIFSQRGAHALLLSPEEFLDPFFWDIANLNGVHYSEIFCRAVNQVNVSHADIVIDVRKIEKYFSLI